MAKETVGGIAKFRVQYQLVNSGSLTTIELKDSGGWLVGASNGFSIPDSDLLSERGPRQHGGTYIEAWYRPRRCDLVVLVSASTVSLFELRLRDLGIMFNPLNTVCRILVLTDQLGTEYSLDVRLNGPLEVRRISPVSAQARVSLIAHDPFFKSALSLDAGTSTITTGLTIPFTIPATITSPNRFDTTIDNEGDVPTGPVIEIDGPCTNPVLANITSGKILGVNVVVPTGGVLTIDMGLRTITLVSGGSTSNLLGSMTGVFWELLPGTNDVSIYSQDPSNPFDTTISWIGKFLGVI